MQKKKYKHMFCCSPCDDEKKLKLIEAKPLTMILLKNYVSSSEIIIK